jgi:branched-chain amino acid transport system ATP-binding protein/branched-chain amino acid transport system permease protein
MPNARDLLIAAIFLVLLPFALTSLGLGITSATEVVVFAIACSALNILVGYTGLTSFGHGAWFGLAAYAAGLAQLNLFPGSIVLPVAAGMAAVAVVSLAFGYVILRRRGVYFSLLTLALAAMLYTIAFRWTEVTGGENGLGGITRPALVGLPLDNAVAFYVRVCRGVPAMALSPLAGGTRAGRYPRE